MKACGTCAHAFDVDPLGPWARGQRKPFAESHIHCRLFNVKYFGAGLENSRSLIIGRKSPCQMEPNKWKKYEGSGYLG